MSDWVSNTRDIEVAHLILLEVLGVEILNRECVAIDLSYWVWVQGLT